MRAISIPRGRIVELFGKGLTVQQIAARLGTTTEIVSKCLKRNGVERKTGNYGMQYYGAQFERGKM